MSDRLCAICVETVESGTDESKWGMDYGSLGSMWFHYRCIDQLFDASRRVRQRPEVAALEQRVERLEKLLGRAADYIERSNSDDLHDLVGLPPAKDTVELLREEAFAAQETDE